MLVLYNNTNYLSIICIIYMCYLLLYCILYICAYLYILSMIIYVKTTTTFLIFIIII